MSIYPGQILFLGQSGHRQVLDEELHPSLPAGIQPDICAMAGAFAYSEHLPKFFSQPAGGSARPSLETVAAVVLVRKKGCPIC